MPRFSPSGFFGPSRYLIPTPGLTSMHFRICTYVGIFLCMSNESKRDYRLCTYVGLFLYRYIPQVERRIYVAACCSMLQCVAVFVAMCICGSLFLSVDSGSGVEDLWCGALQCVVMCCSVLQCVVVCTWVSFCIGRYCKWSGGSVLQCVAVCCSVLHSLHTWVSCYIGRHCKWSGGSMLQHVAVCCSVCCTGMHVGLFLYR